MHVNRPGAVHVRFILHVSSSEAIRRQTPDLIRVRLPRIRWCTRNTDRTVRSVDRVRRPRRIPHRTAFRQFSCDGARGTLLGPEVV